MSMHSYLASLLWLCLPVIEADGLVPVTVLAVAVELVDVVGRVMPAEDAAAAIDAIALF